MFTGIVEELGEVVRVDRHGDGAVLAVRGPVVTDGTGLGDSICVNGVCLTVTSVDGDVFSADLMKETLDRSALGMAVPGEFVNLERAVTASSRLGGHIVQGHADGMGAVLSRVPGDRFLVMGVSLPEGLGRYVVEKGSISVDGVSLTVVSVDYSSFTVSLTPTTVQLTNLGHKAVGSLVNIEVDMIAKYVEKLVGALR